LQNTPQSEATQADEPSSSHPECTQEFKSKVEDLEKFSKISLGVEHDEYCNYEVITLARILSLYTHYVSYYTELSITNEREDQGPGNSYIHNYGFLYDYIVSDPENGGQDSLCSSEMVSQFIYLSEDSYLVFLKLIKIKKILEELEKNEKYSSCDILSQRIIQIKNMIFDQKYFKVFYEISLIDGGDYIDKIFNQINDCFQFISCINNRLCSSRWMQHLVNEINIYIDQVDGDAFHLERKKRVGSYFKMSDQSFTAFLQWSLSHITLKNDSFCNHCSELINNIMRISGYLKNDLRPTYSFKKNILLEELAMIVLLCANILAKIRSTSNEMTEDESLPSYRMSDVFISIIFELLKSINNLVFSFLSSLLWEGELYPISSVEVFIDKLFFTLEYARSHIGGDFERPQNIISEVSAEFELYFMPWWHSSIMKKIETISPPAKPEGEGKSFLSSIFLLSQNDSQKCQKAVSGYKAIL
jgi:hypothetical protein